MRKNILYFIIFFISIFIFPVICTKSSVEIVTANQNNIEEKKIAKIYNDSKYSEIKLYHTTTKKVEDIQLDEYIYGTVSAEMPANYSIEALKAQAIVSRTYTLYQILNNNNKHNNADICDNYACCQAWISKKDRLEKWNESEREKNWNRIVEAVDSTSGKIITYNGKPINAFFHSNSGGITEDVSNIWGEKELPYLQSVETVGEDSYKQYSSEVILTKNELINKMKTKYSYINIDWNDKESIKILEYTNSKRVKTIKIGNIKIAGTEARSLLGLKSTNFTFKIENNNITFFVIGYGHGVGMSQTGADSMAKKGKKFGDIIKHFYTGVEIINVNDLK